MKNSSSPSQTDGLMTDGQINKIADNIRAMLRKSRNNHLAGRIQQALEHGLLDTELVPAVTNAVERAVEKATNTIVRTVVVNYDLDPQKVVDIAIWDKQIDNSTLITMPRIDNGIKEVQIEIFKLDRWVDFKELAKEYKKRGLISDPYAQAALNDTDRRLVDEHPNITNWRDTNGRWCSICFSRPNPHGIHLSVNHNGDNSNLKWFGGYWWFGGVRKK